MSIPRCYLTKTSNFVKLMDTVIEQEQPEYFDTAFLKSMGFTDGNDKNFITLFKALHLIHDNKEPTPDYRKIQDPVYGKAELAKLIRNAYSDVFKAREDAQHLSPQESKQLFRQLCPKDRDRAIEQKSRTFCYLCKYADWKHPLTSTYSASEAEFPNVHHLTYILKNLENSIREFDMTFHKEKELQEFLQSYFKAIFRTITREKPIDTGFSARKPDLFIPELNASIEVKYTNSSMTITSLADQIAADITHYTTEFNYFFIYDINGVVKDPAFFKSQYENYSTEQKQVHVVIMSK